MTGPSQSPVVVSRIQNRRGTQDQFNALYPPGYAGIGGFGSIPGFNITNFPNVLMPGELALCTDSRRIFMGNINGEFVELAEQLAGGLFLGPLTITLPPVPVFTVIPALEYNVTPFTSFLYSLTDSPSPDWNSPGVNFARNGEFQITAIAPPNVNLTDSCTEINNFPPMPPSVSFIAQYDITGTKIDILYKHDFPVSLTFNSATIKWITF